MSQSLWHIRLYPFYRQHEPESHVWLHLTSLQWWIIDTAAGLQGITCKETRHRTRVRAAREDGETMERGGWWWRRLSMRMKRFKKKKRITKGNIFNRNQSCLKVHSAKNEALFSNAIKWLLVHSRSLLVLRPQTDWKVFQHVILTAAARLKTSFTCAPRSGDVSLKKK